MLKLVLKRRLMIDSQVPSDSQLSCFCEHVLPSGMNKAEGSSDELPIVLEGETVEDFRAVLKYLYAP
jgi:hypothetical protein